MRVIGAFEARNKLCQLLNLAETGEEVLITRHGKPVARLVPVGQRSDSQEARAAVQRIRARAEQLKPGAFVWCEWKAYRDEGRP